MTKKYFLKSYITLISFIFSFLYPIYCYGDSMPPKALIFEKESFTVVGYEVRTNNQAEMSSQAKIGPHWQAFYEKNIASQIPHKKDPNILYGVYTDYESDANGDYSVIIGYEVSKVEDNLPDFLTVKEVPASLYKSYTSEKGKMPDVVIDTWKQIWTDTSIERAYKSDFEIYKGQIDPNKAEVDFLISIR